MRSKDNLSISGAKFTPIETTIKVNTTQNRRSSLIMVNDIEILPWMPQFGIWVDIARIRIRILTRSVSDHQEKIYPAKLIWFGSDPIQSLPLLFLSLNAKKWWLKSRLCRCSYFISILSCLIDNEVLNLKLNRYWRIKFKAIDFMWI